MNEMMANSTEFLFSEERKKKLIDYINEKKQVKVADLCDLFSVSSSTIRNDLRELDNAGFIVRTHGGAIKRTKTSYETLINEQREQSNREAKRAIAFAALDMIENGDTIILDTGTSVRELAHLLGQKQDITLVTNDIATASILESNATCEIFLIGGLIRRGFHCTLGYGMYPLLDSLSVDKAFIGTNSFSLEKGASAPSIPQAEIKRHMIQAAAKVILLCDESKLESNSFMSFASCEEINTLITNSMDRELRQLYEARGLEVICTDVVKN